MDKEDLILQYLEKIDTKLDNLNGRTRKLEIWRGYMIGIGTGIAFGVSLLVKYLV